MFTILCFSLFTMLSAFAMNIWTLAVLRFFAGVGIGGEWSMGATLLSEEWPEKRRTMGVSLMHTGYYFGFFLAALANYFIGSHFGWRAMFVVGGLPALLVAFFYKRLREPTRWKKKRTELEGKWSVFQAFSALFTPQYRRRTILNSIYLLISTIGLWGGSFYVPSAVTYLAAKDGMTAMEGARWASYGTALLSIGTIIGALIVPGIADRFGRRINLAIFFAAMFSFIVLAFGYVYYLSIALSSGSWSASFFLGLGEQISLYIRFGCRNNTVRNAAAAPSLSRAMSGDSWEQELHILLAPESVTFKPLAFPLL